MNNKGLLIALKNLRTEILDIPDQVRQAEVCAPRVITHAKEKIIPQLEIIEKEMFERLADPKQIVMK